MKDAIKYSRYDQAVAFPAEQMEPTILGEGENANFGSQDPLAL